MAQRPAWKVPPEAVAHAGEVSSSSLEQFLKCPFGWALHYRARLEPGAGVDLPSGSRLLGDFAHRILQSMLCGPQKLDFATAKEADARTWARKAFEERVVLEAAPLVRRGGEVELDRAKTLVSNAAVALLAFLQASGWKPVAAEHSVTGTFGGFPANGRIDLLVEKNGDPAVVDLKLSGLKYKREELEAGHALQLALYASLVKKRPDVLPPSGFFVLEDGQFLTTQSTEFPGAVSVEGPDARATLDGAILGFTYWRSVLAKGVLPVLGEKLAWEEAVTAAVGPPPAKDSPARRPEPCKFCHYKSICVPPAVVDEGEGA